MSHAPRPIEGNALDYTGVPFKAGDLVRVFYRSDKQPRQFRFNACQSRYEGLCLPRHGLSDGWLLADIVEDYNPSNYECGNRRTYPKVRYYHRLWFNRHGNPSKYRDERPVDHLLPCLVEKVDDSEKGLSNSLPCIREFIPEIGFLVFRWAGEKAPQWTNEWGESGSSVSDQYIRSFFDRAVLPEVRQSFEVWTVFIEKGSDLQKFANTVQLTVSSSHPLRRCKKVAALYFLWPTQYNEKCEMLLETGLDEGSGYVNSQHLLTCMRATEKVGIPTRFPHPANLYELLVSKSYMHYLPSTEWQLPVTISVPISVVAEIPDSYPHKILEKLNHVYHASTSVTNSTSTCSDMSNDSNKN